MCYINLCKGTGTTDAICKQGRSLVVVVPQVKVKAIASKR